ncbi:hypothetical protein AB4Z29_30475 [Paenibacillus sp. 2TAB23]
MSLIHEFFLVPNTTDVQQFWMEIQNRPDIFDNESAIILGNVFNSWKLSFENSPEVLKLTGENFTIVDQDDSGRYEKLFLNRNEVLKKFDKIVLWRAVLLSCYDCAAVWSHHDKHFHTLG